MEKEAYAANGNGSGRIRIKTNVALPRNYIIGVSSPKPNKGAWCILYWTGTAWRKIRSCIQDIGEGKKLYFATQTAIGANTVNSDYTLA